MERREETLIEAKYRKNKIIIRDRFSSKSKSVNDLIRRVFYEIRKTITKYLKVYYQRETFGEEDANRYFSFDESLINHINGRQIYLIELTDNITKEFRYEFVENRDTNILKYFITSYVNKGNHIVTDG